ncbi:MAG: peptidoglycan DD-metalloendopeptidase family protein [Oscillospiraceae bacterium]
MKNSKILVRVVAVVLLIAMCMTMILPIFAGATTAQDDFKNAQEELDRINKELNNIKNEKKKQETAKKNAQSQISLVKQQLAALTAQVNETSERLAQKQAELDTKKRDIYETDELFKQRLRAKYIKRSGGDVATLLAVESYSKFLTSAVYLQKVSQADTDLLKRLDEEKKAIEADEAVIKEELSALEASKKLQEQKQVELAGLLKKVNASLTDVQAKEASTKEDYEAAYNQYVAARAAVEKEFGISGGMGDYVGGDWMWPVPSSRRITSRYGPRILYGKPDNHTGLDIGAGYGQAILASNAGVVTVASYGSTGYGNRVMLDHGGDKKTLYAHCSSLAVTPGQYVEKGQVIAYIGSTGNSTGNHLHFEIRMGGATVNPLPYIQNN